MLPSKGYFNDIECPYLENNCGRPYCHFNHRKKQQDDVNEVALEESSSKEIPTYKPTPKSELAVRKSHIPISYVPDVYKVEKSTTRSFRSNTLSDIVYKPTPISLLNSSVKSSAKSDNNSISNSENNIESKYIPENAVKGKSKNEITLNDNIEEYEYKPTEQRIKYEYNPTSHKDVNEESLLDIVYRPNSSGLNEVSNVKYTPSARSKQNSNINFENLDNEFEMIDEIINMSDIPIKSEADAEPITRVCENERTSSESNSETGSSSHINQIPSKTTDKLDSGYKSDTYGKSRISGEQKDKELKSKENRQDGKEKKNDKRKEKVEKEKIEEINNKTKVERKDRKSDEKDKGERRESKSKDPKRNDKRKSESSRSQDKDKKIIDKKSKDTKEQNSCTKREMDKSSNKSKKKEKEDEKKEGRAHSRSKERDKNKHSKYKAENNECDRKHEKRHTKHEKTRKRESSSSESEKRKTLEMFEDIESKEFSSLDFDYDMDIDEKQTMEECFKIFNEYKPTVAQPVEEITVPIKNESDLAEDTALTKKRIAHSNASNMLTKLQHQKPISKPTPGQIMNNRLKIAKAAQAYNEEKLITNEVKNVMKRPQPSQLFKPAKKPKFNEEKPFLPPSNTSLIDEIINRTNSKPAVKKIAPVSNVLNIQKAKANLKILNTKQTTEQSTKTIAQTNKTGKRQAHIPDYSLIDIPDVIDVDKSKLPVNVRSRFLTLLADECCKLYLTQKDAYKRALDEEYSCYQKCKVLVTYRNSAMLAVNRLRKEVKEREEKNLGPIGSDESCQANKGDAEKKALFAKIQQYVLTNEELDIHGYPRESRIPGKAIIKNRKTLSIVPLPKNQKKCCRCSKIYLIDDEGKAVYEEECLYHPLKKRTIRGEHIYLCCKSTDDSGCVTCHTHVSEAPEDAELDGFQTTLPPNGDNDPRSNAIYALDCEMCYTTKGLELTRVTVIDTNCKTVYESLVKPLNEIIDYNTRFSGITKQQMDRTSTGILQVQANILHLCNSKTILIGHSLESDMKALKIIHGTIVDTAVLFPHKMGLPHKRALRTLASDYLKKIIQNDVGGHDSAEDAITCMELIKWKVKEDSKFKN
ncbi:RNA exonuclease 1 homolog [Coccinella septempunctata]|uniref:RNA exonuclease 1 homolog n=1 Tax=Coccinella septempunctata TaxID=41139 RepID=UPI001D0822E1|nr:RNA exonuclease 1 homolog [Coccinella septempunctata]